MLKVSPISMFRAAESTKNVKSPVKAGVWERAYQVPLAGTGPRGMVYGKTVAQAKAGKLPQRTVEVTAYSNILARLPARGEDAAMTVLLGNGAFASRRSLKRFVHAMLGAAKEDGQALNVLAYGDPLDGKAYAPADRMQRFAAVALDAGQRFRQPLHIVGHSWSWPDAVHFTEQLGGAGGVEVATLVGYTPTNQLVDRPRRSGTLLRGLLRETAEIPRTQNGWATAAIAGSLALSAAVHFVTAPFTIWRAGRQTFEPDLTTERVRQISRRPGGPAIGILCGDRDAVYPLEDTLDTLFGADAELAANAGLDGELEVMPDTTHLSAVADPRHGADLYRFIAELHRENRPAIIQHAGHMALAA